VQSTLRGLISWLVKIAVLGSMTLWGISTLPIVSAQTMSSGSFDFVVMGDMPYNTKEVNREGHFERLIAAINKLQPAFSIHIGDIKSGSTLCDDATFEFTTGHFFSSK
jgi:hypothetical protein